ncbi:MAG: sigma-70 family RNA polymerase sigma factor [Planctomycetota bacterium]
MISSDITRILQRIQSGHEEAAPELLAVVYEELREMARLLMQEERSGHTLQPTALVHEAYVRLLGDSEIPYKSRAHFFGAAATAMRRILVDYARLHRAQKRGGQSQRIPLGQTPIPLQTHAETIVAVHEALEQLSTRDARRGQLVELRFFGGLSFEEIACVLDVSLRTVKREWSCAKAWLYRRMNAGWDSIPQ